MGERAALSSPAFVRLQQQRVDDALARVRCVRMCKMCAHRPESPPAPLETPTLADSQRPCRWRASARRCAGSTVSCTRITRIERACKRTACWPPPHSTRPPAPTPANLHLRTPLGQSTPAPAPAPATAFAKVWSRASPYAAWPPRKQRACWAPSLDLRRSLKRRPAASCRPRICCPSTRPSSFGPAHERPPRSPSSGKPAPWAMRPRCLAGCDSTGFPPASVRSRRRRRH